MNNKTTPKDFFMHVGATIVLYVAVISLINLSFSVINYFFPDKLSGYFVVASVAWPVSALIVLVPVFYLLEWLIGRDIRLMPEKQFIGIFRARIYLTLFLAGATIIGDLITLLYTYLNGEISSRFIFKVIVVLVMAVIIFAYYILEHMNKSNKNGRQKIIAWLGIVLVIIAIVTGFMTIGSPGKQRALRFDNQRISDLSNIQWQITNYWQKKGKIIQSLDELNDDLSGYNVPVDPEDGRSYEYIPKGDKTFELCAEFNYPTQDIENRGGSPSAGYLTTDYYYYNNQDSWKHKEDGRQCFERTIDPQLYPVKPVSSY